MEGARSAGETNNGHFSDGEGNRGLDDHIPVRGSEDEGEARAVSISMEGGEAGQDDEDMVSQKLQRRLLLRCAVCTIFIM